MSEGVPPRLAAALDGRYTFERELGAGGMATVYLAEDLKHHRRVAIKVLRPELTQALGAERFLLEIATTANLRHPHILPLYDSGEAGGALYYVMPLVEGESLRDRLTRQKQLPIDEALAIAREVGDALEYAHQRGVVHRDIKPENVLLEGGHAVVADFGIARAVSAAGADRLTQSGVSIGTPLYMSPEQAAADPDVDGRSDVYSLGCVLYEMLAGQAPFTGPTSEAIVRQHMLADAAPITNLRPTVPAEVAWVIARALAKNPADRFNSAAEFVQALATGRTAATHAVTSASLVTPSTRRRWLGFALGTIAVLAAATYLLVLRGAPRSAAATAAIRSIAVLPLDNYSGDSTQEYFAEGMTDELTSDLASISQLRVTSRGSAMQFKGSSRPPTPAIAKALDVDAIVEGSVSRSGDRVRITAQLIDARADRHLWGQTFERRSSDVLALQAEMASAIASAINVQLTPREQSRLSAAPSVNPEAHDAYLRGRFFFNRPSDANLQQAIAQFRVAVDLSPGFAPAYSGLSDAYTWAAYDEGFIRATDAKPLAKKAAERAVQLDSMSAEAHTSLGVYDGWFEYNWRAGERELRRAIALNPNYAYAHDQLNQLLAILGRFDDAIAEGRRAVELDPLSASIPNDLGLTLMYAGKATEVLELARTAAETDPTLFFPSAAKAGLALQVGNFREAIPSLERARTLGPPRFATALLAYAYGMLGDRSRAMAELENLRSMSPDRAVAPGNLALVYLGLGDRARALDYLEQAYTAGSQTLVWLKVDKIYDPLRSEPRFIALMKRLGFT